jgi:hypothetical protein
MNGKVIEYAVVVAIVAAAAAFAALRVFRSLRRGKAACCGDGTDRKPSDRCRGCSGCGSG